MHQFSAQVYHQVSDRVTQQCKHIGNKVLLSRKSVFYQLLLTFTGCIIITIAVIVFFTQLTLSVLFEQLNHMFSGFFLLLFALLVMLGILALTKMKADVRCDYWCEVGMQAANGLSTIALTFTLLGISLGIGSLAEQPLTANNIQLLIGNLTQHFSMAFMTTVIGLPTSAMLRALVAIKYQDLQVRSER